MYNILDDIHIDYNIITKEITCAGLKISDVITCPIQIFQNNFTKIKIYDQRFIPFQHSECKVHFSLHRFNNCYIF